MALVIGNNLLHMNWHALYCMARDSVVRGDMCYRLIAWQ